ncbi:hypothetical protein J1614_010851, partial [Plenodomus biglobosus]
MVCQGLRPQDAPDLLDAVERNTSLPSFALRVLSTCRTTRPVLNQESQIFHNLCAPSGRLDVVSTCLLGQEASTSPCQSNGALFSPHPVMHSFIVSARRRWSPEQCLFPGIPNTVKPFASPKLQHVRQIQFETNPVIPNEAAKLMRPAQDPPVFRQPDRLLPHNSSTSGLTCLASRFFQTFGLPTWTLPMAAIKT